jgi:hypothetical protein
MTLDIKTSPNAFPSRLPARSQTSAPAARPSRLAALRRAVTARLSGPGGAYTVGNLIGLGQGITAQILAAESGYQSQWMGASAAITEYLAGNFAAVAMTTATAIFFTSSEAYHRAWSGSSKPREGLNRLGDFLSGVGAIWLGLALLELGHPFLALTSGLLHSAGKFGSAFQRSGGRIRTTGSGAPDPFRSMVLLSRVPGLAAAGYGLYGSLFQGVRQQDWSTSATLLACYLLWSWADLLLLRSSSVRPLRDRVAD